MEWYITFYVKISVKRMGVELLVNVPVRFFFKQKLENVLIKRLSILHLTHEKYEGTNRRCCSKPFKRIG